jgi:RecA/RadA recombinase
MARKKPGAPAEGPKMSALAKRFAEVGAKPARSVLIEIEAVPTRFIQFDWATRIGGWPIRRCGVVHGPSNEGKTLFMIGLCGSFVEAGHIADLVDAERTTTTTWCRELLGDTALNERFTARRPDTFEQCVDGTRDLHRLVKQMRLDGELPQGTSVLTVIDSLRKLVPEDIFKKIAKHGAGGEKGSVDGMGGRAAQIRAAMNAAWLDELIPLVDECGTSWSAIARETEDPNADVWDKKFGNDFKIGGGKAVVYDSALGNRVERDKWITVEQNGKNVVVGERHSITIWKTKVGGREDRASVAYFHSSNGVLSPAGFDRPRDVVELALKFGVLEMAGNRVRWPSREKGTSFPGRESAIAGFHAAPDDLALLEAEVRSKFGFNEPVERGSEAT